LSVYKREYVIGKMLFNPDTNTYTDLKDGQLLAKSDKMENEVKSVFEDLYVVELEKEKTLVIKKITNESWSEETKEKGTFFIEERNRDKKGITLTKSDCGKIAIMLKEISEK
tara:strand:- start:1363 stop:1698 length:336 start_codon:yes stop_codon:yes gene_type:complete